MSPNAVLQVAVGVVVNPCGEVLIARRAPTAHQGGLWEFPGGKVEAGEPVEDALARELLEEVALEVVVAKPWFTLTHDYGDRQVALHIFWVSRFKGEARGLEGQPLAWRPIAQLVAADFPAANAPIVAALQEASL
ncbi:MAG: 8-oxo-dGTP diphosphatase MutT [Candidatus Competibacterales bacterium]